VVVALQSASDTKRQYLKRPLWVSVGALVPGEGPDDDGLVSRGGNDHVGILRRCRQSGDPATVTWQLTFLLCKEDSYLEEFLLIRDCLP